MTHYPFAHRRYALLYPWSATLPTFTDFEFVKWQQPFSDASTARLGVDAFTDLTDMLTPSITSDERKVPVNGIRAVFKVKATSIPSGWTVSLNTKDLLIGFYYWTRTADPTSPNTRPQRRNAQHKYAITANIGAGFSMTNGTFNHTFSLGGRWQTFNSPTTGQFTTTDEIPTITRMGQNRYNEHSISRGSADLSSYSSTVSGFSSNVVRDHLVAMQTTLDAEIAAATVGIAYRIAAVLYGVSTAVTNSTGSESLENWVPITF
jgi:hypothetical protein